MYIRTNSGIIICPPFSNGGDIKSPYSYQDGGIFYATGACGCGTEQVIRIIFNRNEFQDPVPD